MMDISGTVSTRGRYERVISAVQRLLDTMSPDDYVNVIAVCDNTSNCFTISMPMTCMF